MCVQCNEEIAEQKLNNTRMLAEDEDKDCGLVSFLAVCRWRQGLASLPLLSVWN
jgi:hypothetical protein